MSIYEKIIQNLTEEGVLPNDFSLEEPVAPNQLRFAPGLMDSIFSSDTKGVRRILKKILRLLLKYFETMDQKHLEKIEAHMGEVRAISLVDPILQSICEKHTKIDADKMIIASKHLIKTSDNTEIVKMGIALLGLVDLGYDEEVIELVKTLAIYDDFTLYAVVAAHSWTNGNSIVFHMAQRALGWGKIHAVERLEPETPEIRHWILHKGCENGIMDAYLGLECAQKANLIEVLRQETIDIDSFNSASVILNAMLDEGPVDGISVYEYSDEAITLFLKHAQEQASDVVHLWRILNLHNYLKSSKRDQKEELLNQCNEIIERSSWKQEIIKKIKMGDQNDLFYASNVARRLGMDITHELFDLVKMDVIKYCFYFSPICKNESMAQEIIALCEEMLPLSEMSEGMGDYLFADKLNNEHMCLDMILPELVAHPSQGVELIMTGLNSRVIRGRNMACRALSGWVEKLDKPLSEIAPNLYIEIERIYPLEVDEHVKKSMKALLDGTFIKEEPYIAYNDE